MKKMLTATLVVVLAALVAACGGGTDTNEQGAPTTVPIVDVSVTASVDWEARTVEVTGLEGYEIEFCEGEAPALCVTAGGEWIGGLELVSFPGSAALEAGVEAWAADLYESLAVDRRIGCDPGYDVAGDDPEPAPFAGADGYRYGFTGTLDGRVVERVVGHVAVVGGDLHLLVLNALADDGCLGRESELPVGSVDDLEPVLAAIAAGSTNLPDIVDVVGDESPPTTVAPETPASQDGDGIRSGWLRGSSGEGFIDIDVAVMLSGQEAVDAAREDGQLPPDGQLPNDFYIDDDESSITIIPLSDRLVVELYDCTAGCELRVVSTDDFLAHRVQPFGGEHALVSVEIRDGQAVHLREIYVP